MNIYKKQIIYLLKQFVLFFILEIFNILMHNNKLKHPIRKALKKIILSIKILIVIFLTFFNI